MRAIAESFGIPRELSEPIFMPGIPGIPACASCGLDIGIWCSPRSIPGIAPPDIGITAPDSMRFGRTRT